MKDNLGNISNVQCDLGGRNRRCFRRAGRKFLELDGFLPQQCTPHFSLPAVEAGKRYAILCTPTFYALPTLFRCSNRLIPLLFPYCHCLLLHGVLLAASLYFLDCSQKYIFSMVLFSHFGEIEERHGFIRRIPSTLKIVLNLIFNHLHFVYQTILPSLPSFHTYGDTHARHRLHTIHKNKI